MQVLIMGAGAIGSAVAGFMAQAGHRVTLVGRESHMDAIAAHGLRISGIWGDHHVTHGLIPRTDLDGLEPSTFDWVLITTKSYDTAAAAAALTPLVGPDTLVCSYQNGLGNAETIAQHIGWPQTVGARAIYGVRLTEPGAITVTVIAEPTALGVYDPATPVDRVQAMASAMDAAGLPTVYTEAISTVLWAKVAYNCALNPLSALLDVPYGALAETENTRAILREVVTELYAVGQAMGIALEPASAEAYCRHLFDNLIPPTAAHYASMHDDLQHGRPTEIDALNGAIARYGAQYGIPCPTNTLLTRLIKAHEHHHAPPR